MIEKIDIHCFSGTGNTLPAARGMAAADLLPAAGVHTAGSGPDRAAESMTPGQGGGK
jgi:hypothetical protein